MVTPAVLLLLGHAGPADQDAVTKEVVGLCVATADPCEGGGQVMWPPAAAERCRTGRSVCSPQGKR